MNPFKYGEAVTGECFTNRKKEIHEITEYIKAGQNIFIYSQRRLGKTSLIKTIIESLVKKKQIIPIYIDMQQVTSQAEFLEVYSKEISKGLISWKEKMESVASFFQRIVPSFEIDKDGNFKVSFSFSKTRESIDRALEEVYELPRTIADKYKKRVLVVFDEFQEIDKLNGENFEKKMRSFIQHHNEVCYIFMGSKTHIMLDMFNNPRRAFYKSAAVYPLLLMPTGEMIEFICGRFASTNKIIFPELARSVVETCENSPYYIQMFCWNIWLIVDKKVTQRDIDMALDEIMHNQNELFFNWYDLLSLHQRGVLKTLAETGDIFSQDTILRYNLGSSSTVQSSVKRLIKNGFVSKDERGYYVADPFFRRWLAHM